jgi:hypothetical protein
MKSILKCLLYSLCIILSCSGGTKKAAPVQEYYKEDSALIVRLRENPESAVLVPDVDETYSHSLSAADSARCVMGVLTPREAGSALWSHGRILFGAMWYQGLHDDNGAKIVGVGGNIRHLAEKIPAFKKHYTKIITALGYAKPIKPMIKLFQDLEKRYELPIVPWTNNDQEVWLIKHDNLNTALHAEGLSPLMVQGAFYGGQQAEGVAQEQYCVSGKPHQHYYEKALAYTQGVVGDTDGSRIYIFIDDKKPNVEAARKHAEKTGAPLIAVQRHIDDGDAQQCKDEMEWLFGEKIC